MKPELIIKKIITKAVMNGWGDKNASYILGNMDTDEPTLRITDKDNNTKVHGLCHILFSHDFARALWSEGHEWQARLDSLATAEDRIKYLYQFI